MERHKGSKPHPNPLGSRGKSSAQIGNAALSRVNHSMKDKQAPKPKSAMSPLKTKPNGSASPSSKYNARNSIVPRRKEEEDGNMRREKEKLRKEEDEVKRKLAMAKSKINYADMYGTDLLDSEESARLQKEKEQRNVRIAELKKLLAQKQTQKLALAKQRKADVKRGGTATVKQASKSGAGSSGVAAAKSKRAAAQPVADIKLELQAQRLREKLIKAGLVSGDKKEPLYREYAHKDRKKESEPSGRRISSEKTPRDKSKELDKRVSKQDGYRRAEKRKPRWEEHEPSYSSVDENVDDDESDLSGFIDDDSEDTDRARAELRKLLGGRRRRPEYYSDDDDDNDSDDGFVGTFEDIEREEERSRRIAKREDATEAEREEERRRQKALKKKQLSKKRRLEDDDDD